MEKDNDRNNQIQEFDFLRLKDHLNVSFNQDGITVTDDLIQRTLQAVKENPSSEVGTKEVKEKKKFPVRSFVQVAAAILFVFVFFAFANNFQIGSKKCTENATTSSEDSAAREGTATTETAMPNTKMQSNVKTEEAPEMFDAASTEAAYEINGEAELPANCFTERYPIAVEQVQSVSITSNADGTMIEDNEHINELFTILDAYSLTNGDKNINNAWKYKIELKTDDIQTYTVLIGDGIQIKQSGDDTESDTYYSLENVDNLLLQMETFYKSLLTD